MQVKKDTFWFVENPNSKVLFDNFDEAAGAFKALIKKGSKPDEITVWTVDISSGGLKMVEISWKDLAVAILKE